MRRRGRVVVDERRAKSRVGLAMATSGFELVRRDPPADMADLIDALRAMPT